MKRTGNYWDLALRMCSFSRPDDSAALPEPYHFCHIFCMFKTTIPRSQYRDKLIKHNIQLTRKTKNIVRTEHTAMNTRQLITVLIMSVLFFVVNGKYLDLWRIAFDEDFCMISWGLFLYTADNLRGIVDEFEDTNLEKDNRHLKWNSAQKRQFQRDRRREGTGRTQEDEDKERWRKHNQAIKRGRSRVDPYEPKHGGRNFMRRRKNGANWSKNRITNPHWWPN